METSNSVGERDLRLSVIDDDAVFRDTLRPTAIILPNAEDHGTQGCADRAVRSQIDFSPSLILSVLRRIGDDCGPAPDPIPDQALHP